MEGFYFQNKGLSEKRDWNDELHLCYIIDVNSSMWLGVNAQRALFYFDLKSFFFENSI